MRRRVIGSSRSVSFEVVRPFGDLPEGLTWGGVSACCVDSSDRVYVLRRADPPILVFEPDGSYAGSFGAGELIEGHGMSITPDDEIWVTDKDGHTAVKFSTGGEALLRLGTPDTPTLGAPFGHPADVAVHRATGDIFVSDGYGNSRIHRFSASGDLIGGWGEAGQGPGQFTVPHAIWIDRRDRVLVADRENMRIQIFTLGGDLIEEWRDHYKPMDIYVDARDRVYVTDQVPRLTVMTLDGEVIARGLHRGHGIWGDSAGNIYSCWPQPADNPVVKLEALP